MCLSTKTKLILVFIFYLSLAQTDKIQSRCQNMLQKSGQCTKCPPSKFLYKGDCYNKIRGCQDYVSNKICLSCQAGYAFNEGSCIKEAVFFRLQKADIPPVKINIQGQLTYRDIQQRIGQSRKGLFEMINRHFKDKYPVNLSSCTINNVKYIETINGVIFTIYYRSMMKIYQAVAFIDSKRDSKRNKTVTQLQFNQRNSIPDYSLQQINSGLKKKYEHTLKDCLLSTIQKITDNRYKTSYVNSKGLKFECLFTQQPFEEIVQLKKVQNPIDLEDILAYIFSIYPDLKSLDFQIKSAPYFESNSNQGVYVIIFGQKLQIKIQNRKGVFDLLSFKNLQLQEKQNQSIQKDYKSDKQIVGGYSVFEDLTDPIFMQVWRYFISQYGKYQKYQITSVQHQIVSGQNFIIKIKSPKQVVFQQHVRALVYYSLTGPIQVLQLQVQGQVVDLNTDDYKQASDKEKTLQKTKSNSDCYQYNKDADFGQAYRFMLNTLKIVNTVPIIQVKKLQSQQNIDYEIIYSDKQKAKVRKIKDNNNNLRKDSNKYELIHYLVDGTDLASGRKISLSNKQKCGDFIKLQKPQIIKNYIINKFKQTQKGYQLSIISSTGIYSAQIQSDSYDMHLKSLIRSSSSNTYELAYNQFSTSQDVNNVDQFMKNNFNMAESILQLFQVQVKDNSKIYRVIYVDKQNKKNQVILQNFNGKFIIFQSLILQDGYVSLANGDIRILPVQAISRLHFGQFIKNCFIKNKLTNQTHYKLIYSCPNKAFQYIYYPVLKTDKLQIIYQQFDSSLISGQNQNKNSISLKQAIQDKQFIDIDNMVRSKFVEYVQNSQVTNIQRLQLKDKDNRTYLFYKLYYKSSLGYYICEVTWSNGQIRIPNFYLATTQTNKNCQILEQKSNTCIKCLSNYQLEFGKCYQKIQSCLTQTGKVCVQCDNKSLLRNGKCLRNSDQAFKLRQIKKLQQ